jgi:CheY-like chemotaxis protein
MSQAIDITACEHEPITIPGSIQPHGCLLVLRGANLVVVRASAIGNALKFTSKGEVIIRVSKKTETETQAKIQFEVEDSGIGIPLQAQARLFQAFSQADDSTTRKYGGTGLGLAIARQLVALMDGEIGVRSEPGKGSTFWFTAQLEKQSGPSETWQASPLDQSHVRVLVVDDNRTNRQILLNQVAAWKMQAHGAASGEEALDRLRDGAREGQPYDFALLDVQMPEMDGFALAASIKADPVLAGTRLIMLTSVSHSIRSAELKQLGIETYLVKPVKQSRLLDCLLGQARSTVDSEETRGVLAAEIFSATSLEIDPELKQERILLAEDNLVNQKVTLAQLGVLHFRADTVATGREALEALQRIPYDLIFLDCQMPVMDGYETAQAIRDQENRPDSPCPWKSPVHIIALTAHAMQGEREKCLQAGMDDYLSKPLRPTELKAALERWQIAARRPSRAAAPAR